ncbi:putative membrane protein [Acinetobacter sp. 1566109]|nr:putative membrane protein [Acinetobacter sp. 1566109]
MSGLFFMVISILGGFAGLIILAVTLPRLDRSVRNLSVNKFILALLYWISSTIIFMLFGISKFFFNNPLVLLVFVLVFFSSIYLSVIRLADMRKKDWLILSGIFGAIVLFFFLPEL